MRKDKQDAVEYRNKGFSYSEISKKLGIPKSTLSFWLKDLKLSHSAKKLIRAKYTEGYKKGLLRKSRLQTTNAIKTHANTRRIAETEIKRFSERDLFILGLGLYWGEGYKKIKVINGVKKTNHPVSLSNSDPLLIKAYIKFLTNICGVNKDKIKASLRIYDPKKEASTRKFWQKVTGLHKDQFTKSYFGISKASAHKKPIDSLPHGTIRIDIYNTPLFHKIMGWLDGLKNLQG